MQLRAAHLLLRHLKVSASEQKYNFSFSKNLRDRQQL